MMHEPQTFPTLRSWRRMSERQQDAFLDKLESKKRRRVVRSRALIAVACVAAAGIASALIFALT